MAPLGLAEAQSSRHPAKIGELWTGTEAAVAPARRPFLEGMRALGWIDGQTAQFVVRYGGREPTRLPLLAAELVALGVDVLVVSDAALPAARQATATIPIVCLDMYDPVAEGVAASLGRPGGNVSGVSWQTVDSAAKRLELAKELIPSLRRVALLTNMADPGAHVEAQGLRASTADAGLQLRIFSFRNAGELSDALAGINRYRPDAMIVSFNSLTIQHLDDIARFASTSRLPAISEASRFADAGFVLTYGADVADTYKRGAIQVDRVLRGANPAELPFEQPMKFDLTVNLNAAKALGLTIPQSILVRTTELIR